MGESEERRAGSARSGSEGVHAGRGGEHEERDLGRRESAATREMRVRPREPPRRRATGWEKRRRA